MHLPKSKQKTIYPTFLTLKLKKKIFTVKISCLKSIFCWPKTSTLFHGIKKLSDQNKHERIYMLWKECIPSDFYKFISREDHFIYLNGKKKFCPPKLQRLYKKLQLKMTKTIINLEITSVSLRKSFDMCIECFFSKSIVQLNVEGLIWKAHFK